jgi:hypothetical protein
MSLTLRASVAASRQLIRELGRGATYETYVESIKAAGGEPNKLACWFDHYTAVWGNAPIADGVNISRNGECRGVNAKALNYAVRAVLRKLGPSATLEEVNSVLLPEGWPKCSEVRFTYCYETAFRDKNLPTVTRGDTIGSSLDYMPTVVRVWLVIRRAGGVEKAKAILKDKKHSDYAAVQSAVEAVGSPERMVHLMSAIAAAEELVREVYRGELLRAKAKENCSGNQSIAS